MTKKEREVLISALGAINSTISELNFYKSSGWLQDTGALNRAEECKEYISKLFKK